MPNPVLVEVTRGNLVESRHSGAVAVGDADGAGAMGAGPGGYAEAGHPVQREVQAALESLSGTAIPDARRAIDGCSVPTWAMPLSGLARAFAAFASGRGLAPRRAAAAQRLR